MILNRIIHFVCLNIPDLSEKDLTTSYNAPSWETLNNTWVISMYLTYPDSDVPVDRPTDIIVSYSKDSDVNIILDKIIKDNIGAWERLADL